MGISMSSIISDIKIKIITAYTGMSPAEYEGIQAITARMKEEGFLEADFNDMKNGLSNIMDDSITTVNNMDDKELKEMEKEEDYIEGSIQLWFPESTDNHIKSFEDFKVLSLEDKIYNMLLFDLAVLDVPTFLLYINNTERFKVYQKVIDRIKVDVPSIPFNLNTFSHDNNIHAVLITLQSPEKLQTITDPNKIQAIKGLQEIGRCYGTMVAGEKKCRHLIAEQHTAQVLQSLGFKWKPAGWFNMFIDVDVS
jgi:hypothetical protein